MTQDVRPRPAAPSTPARTAPDPVDAVPPAGALAVLGVQHVLAFYAGAVIVPLVISQGLNPWQSAPYGSAKSVVFMALSSCWFFFFRVVAAPPKSLSATSVCVRCQFFYFFKNNLHIEAKKYFKSIGLEIFSFAVGPFNIYTVGISHKIAELPMFSG